VAEAIDDTRITARVAMAFAEAFKKKRR